MCFWTRPGPARSVELVEPVEPIEPDPSLKTGQANTLTRFTSSPVLTRWCPLNPLKPPNPSNSPS
ncbi:hypothetical protein SLEP1_g34346 [Rubroshorea leprosula]|uniref:Uncharacterized protein n=1 Tax=Rubroshorea leprosula TaxID=152421 RepID=A0AAV5KJI6_9ROSI|nr:hypothetical protein SLEP1_g34346 [Rubroshorea leprosula]